MEPPNGVRDTQTHQMQCRRRDSRTPAQPPPRQGLRPDGRRRGRKQASLVRSGCQPHTHRASKWSWRSVAANIATVIGARTPARSAPRMFVMQASDKPSPKPPLGQRREFIPCRRLAAHLRGRRHEPVSTAAARSVSEWRISPLWGPWCSSDRNACIVRPDAPLFERAGSGNLYTKDKWSFCLNPA